MVSPSGMILKCWDAGTQCLPPGGRGTAKRWMRNGDTLPFAMRSIQTVQAFPMYLFNEMHTNMEHIAVPHPPQCAHWGTFPPGEGIARHSSLQIPIDRAVGENRYAHLKSSPKGIPHLISHISYLISALGGSLWQYGIGSKNILNISGDLFINSTFILFTGML